VAEHVVRKGDTLADLARRYGTPPQEIQKQNKLTGPGLKAGQVLRIARPPAPAPPAKLAAPKPKAGVYAVRDGDTVYSIARRHNMPVERLLALNHLDARSKLQPGQKLAVDN
jgi:LysM repeat protein